MARDLKKEDLYEAVKVLIDHESEPHLHLSQHKLFTLFSIAFQYLLFSSTKKPGAYIIRIEDSSLVEKLARKSKDPSTRKFIQALLLPRKLKYHKSVFYLDFFHIGTWNMTKDLPPEKIQGALVVKNTSSRPMDDLMDPEDETSLALEGLPKDYYYSMLQEFVPKTLIIAYEHEFQNTTQVEFPFIKKEQDRTVSGVTLGKGMDWDSLE